MGKNISYFREKRADARKYKEFFNLEARKFYFPKYKTFFQSGFFVLFELGKLLPEI